jgi:hypothetical protein
MCARIVDELVKVNHVRQGWLIRWVTKNVLSRAPPGFGRHVKLLVPAAFAIDQQSALRQYGPIIFM